MLTCGNVSYSMMRSQMCDHRKKALEDEGGINAVGPAVHRRLLLHPHMPHRRVVNQQGEVCSTKLVRPRPDLGTDAPVLPPPVKHWTALVLQAPDMPLITECLALEPLSLIPVYPPLPLTPYNSPVLSHHEGFRRN